MNKNRHSEQEKKDRATQIRPNHMRGDGEWEKGEKSSGSFEQTLYILRTINSVRDWLIIWRSWQFFFTEESIIRKKTPWVKVSNSDFFNGEVTYLFHLTFENFSLISDPNFISLLCNFLSMISSKPLSSGHKQSKVNAIIVHEVVRIIEVSSVYHLKWKILSLFPLHTYSKGNMWIHEEPWLRKP